LRVEFALVFAVYVLVGSLIATLSRRLYRGGLSEYYIAGGRAGGLLSAMTYAATTYSAFMMIGLVGLTYATGVGALGFELVYLAATVFLLSTVGYRIWRLSKRYNWLSPPQMLSEIYGVKWLAPLVSAIYLYAMLPYLAAQVAGLRAVFSYGGLGELESLVASAIIIYAWIVVAGMWSVALTDAYQGLFMLSSSLLYLAWVFYFATQASGGDLSRLLEALGERGFLGITPFWSLNTFLAYTIPWALFAVTNPQVVVRLYIPADSKAYKRSVALFFTYGLVYTLIVVSIGLVARGLAILGFVPRDLPRDSVTPHLLGLMNPLLGSLVAVSIVAAAVSTANSIVLAVSGSIASSLGGRVNTLVARLIDAILVVAATVIASLNIGFIVDLSVLTSVILIPLGPATIAAAYIEGAPRRCTRYSALASIIVGIALSTYYAMKLGPRRAFVETVYNVPISLLVLIVSSIPVIIGAVADKALGRKR